MAPPPPPPPPPPSAVSASSSSSSAAAAVSSVPHTVERLTSFGDNLVDFLDKWNSIIAEANAVSASLPPLADPEEPVPEPNPVAERGPVQLLARWNSALVGSASPSAVTARLPVVHRVAESNPRPSPVATVSVYAAPTAAGFPVADPVRGSDPRPRLLSEVDPYHSPEPEPTVPQPAPERERRVGEPSAALLRNICEQMGSRALRRFVIVYLCHSSWLRRVGPGALQRAPDPATLVLRAVSRYYICSESDNVEVACMLLLELYVRAGCPRRPGQGESELGVEARVAVLSWRSWIVREKGRVADASIRDARGLILLMAAFGVPAELPVQELYWLLFAGGGLQCAELLKCSQLFVNKLRDVVVDMLNKGGYHEAISVILAFELQNAFPLEGIITYIVEKVVHIRNEQMSEGLLAGSEEYDEEELVLLRSIYKYVDEHTSGSSEIFCSSIAKRIKLLEERLGQPKQAFAATKRKRTADSSLE